MKWPRFPRERTVDQVWVSVSEPIMANDFVADFRAKEAEALRVSRWHATYNACLTGAGTGGYHDEERSTIELRRCMRDAVIVADLTHGKLDGSTK